LPAALAEEDVAVAVVSPAVASALLSAVLLFAPLVAAVEVLHLLEE
jgi:hypothetical protein